MHCVCEIMCMSFLHIPQLFRKSSDSTKSSLLPPRSCYPFAQISLIVRDVTQSKSQSPCDLQGPVRYLSLHPLASLTHCDCLQSSHSVLTFPQTKGKPWPSGCSLWLWYSFPKYPHGETSYILQVFAHISLFNEDNLAHFIKNTAFVSTILSLTLLKFFLFP